MASKLNIEPERSEIDIFYKLIDVADNNSRSRMELLFRLGFVSGSRYLYRFNNFVTKAIDEFVSLVVLFSIVLAVFAILFKNSELTIASSILAGLTAYFSWIRNQRSKNVDDSIKRKDMANAMIIENKEYLVPYIGNVFNMEAKYKEQHLSLEKRISIEMYVFTEIDNLEFVYEKSRARLIEDTYVIRAIKIFTVRAENEGFFKIALRLIENGRYNEDFSNAVKCLLYVGQWLPDKLNTNY